MNTPSLARHCGSTGHRCLKIDVSDCRLRAHARPKRRQVQVRAEGPSTDERAEDRAVSSTELPAPQASNPVGGLAAAGAVGLGVAAFIFTRLSTGAVTLSTLERTSVPLDSALQNQRPTLVEFYAEWCEVCRELAPTVYQVEEQYKDKVNFVMLNIENQKWAPEVAEYRVGGIPHFVFLDNRGQPEAAAVGRLPPQVLESNVKALAEGETLPFRRAAGATSSLSESRGSMKAPPSAVSPRSHS